MAKGKMGGGALELTQKTKSVAAQSLGQKKSITPTPAPMKAGPHSGGSGGSENAIKAAMPTNGVPNVAKAPEPMQNLGGGKKLGNHYDNGKKAY